MLNRYFSFIIFASLSVVALACGPVHMMTGGSGGEGGGSTCGGCLNASDTCEQGTDVLVCGKDGNSCQECTFANGVGACVDGACVLAACDGYWLDCDGQAGNGCEIEKTDHGNCGACLHACSPEQTCVDEFTQVGFAFTCK